MNRNREERNNQSQAIKIGINARLFPNNWRPLIEEIKFAKDNHFQSIQLSVRDRVIDREFLGDDLCVVAVALEDANLDLAVELLLGVDANGLTSSGKSPIEIFEANLNGLKLLGCRYVHWHLVPSGLNLESMQADVAHAAIDKLEKLLIPQFAQAVQLAEAHQIVFGFEHNEPDLLLFGRPDSCKSLMAAVPGLKFVWDINHTIPEHLPEFADLVANGSIIHVSDTLLPEVNYHLPLGQGNIDFKQIAEILIENRFSGPAIFEIGGLPKSGGYGRDTNEALIESRSILQKALNNV